jgi:hypothetical protein
MSTVKRLKRRILSYEDMIAADACRYDIVTLARQFASGICLLSLAF